MSLTPDMTTPADLASNADLAPAVVVMVGMNGLNFSPADVTIKAGQSVKWIWVSNGHNVVSGSNGIRDNKFCSPSDAAVCDSTGSPTSNTSATYIHTFNNTGTFPYFCQPHSTSNMKGTVTVQ
jgi:plastocyanin